MAVDILREQGKSVGVFTSNVLRPFPAKQLAQKCKNAKTIIVGDRQDSYGANGGNMTLEIKAMLQDAKLDTACYIKNIWSWRTETFMLKTL